MNGLPHARPSLRSGLSCDRPAAGSNVSVKHTGQFTCYEDRTFSLAIDSAVLTGFTVARCDYVATRVVDFAIPSSIPSALPFIFPVAVAVYYLAWKYLVASLNRIVGIWRFRLTDERSS